IRRQEILQYRPQLFYPLEQAARSGNLKATILLMDRSNLQIDASQNEDLAVVPILRAAVLSGELAAVELLFGRGVAVRSGAGLAVEAARSGNAEMLHLLIKRGAGVNEKDAEGQTALHIAASANDEAMARALLVHRADRSIRDKQGKTAAEVARASGHRALADLLAPP
ncbi:MAG TPA: ankyrin repeat domain-containing protein, partial [Prosthecobacter sp.]|nr:ankyrin repeat domain-containing protein [Prosthecobacter sp.]